MYLVPRALGAQIDLLRLRPEQQWRPDFVKLTSMVTEGAEFLALTHPSPNRLHDQLRRAAGGRRDLPIRRRPPHQRRDLRPDD
jgi:hypothetical protein